MSLKSINVNNTLVTRVDSEPTAGSENLVKSGGVFSSIANEIKRATTAETNISIEVAKKIDATNFNNQLQKKADKDDVTASIIALENKIGERTEITGNVVNNPDEEDLTQQNNKLMLKDRAYEPLNYSGKGYKILRKNMAVISIPSATITVLSAPTTDGYISVIIDVVEMHINVTSSDTIYDLCEKISSEIARRFDKFTVTYTDNTVELKGKYEFTITDVAISAVDTGATFGSTINEKIQRNVNLLTQDMITKENTIYVIRYDYELNNESIKIPEGCVLKFDGGSLSNGTLIGNKTKIETDDYSTVFKGIVLSGDFDISHLSVFNFGIINNDVSYAITNSTIFESYVKPSMVNIGLPLIVPFGKMYYNTPIVLDGSFDFICEGAIIYTGIINATALTIGTDGVSISRKNFKINIENYTDINTSYIEENDEWSIPENYGVVLKNLFNCNISI